MIWRIHTRKHWDEDAKWRKFMHSEGLHSLSEEDIIRANAAALLEHLYRFDETSGSVPDYSLLQKLDIPSGRESINWEDLQVNRLEKVDGRFHVILKGVAPSNRNLRTYVQTWLENWGWYCTVEAEW